MGNHHHDCSYCGNEQRCGDDHAADCPKPAHEKALKARHEARKNYIAAATETLRWQLDAAETAAGEHFDREQPMPPNPLTVWELRKPTEAQELERVKPNAEKALGHMYLELHDNDPPSTLCSRIGGNYGLDYDYQAEQWVQESAGYDDAQRCTPGDTKAHWVVRWILYGSDGSERARWERATGDTACPKLVWKSSQFTGEWKLGT